MAISGYIILLFVLFANLSALAGFIFSDKTLYKIIHVCGIFYFNVFIYDLFQKAAAMAAR